ncbi:inositol monophosphatase [Synechococcus sp. BSF8S]|uniref:inositol monophosphatase family protein n=1 Tax=Synechococcus sp. BSF8S TaxID=2599078 RepID=UPI00162607B2|nr:inositol monophosphatase [Synechococcus sp. BSF8S]
MSSLSEQALIESALNSAELERLAAVAREAATAGAGVLAHHFGQLEQIREKGRAGDLVTEADLAAEQAVLAVLEAHTPELGGLAEERGRRNTGSDLEWGVDPLDGTTNYAHGYPFFATSIGLTWRGTPLLGAISVPVLDELFWAAPGLGAWCNDRPLRVSGCRDLAASLLVTGFAYDRQSQPDTNYTEFCWFTHRSRGVRRGGAAAVDLAFVAAGRLDGYWERGLSPWDLAAGVVLVEQAGGVVSRYDGSTADLAEGRLIACTPGVQAALIDGLAHCRPLPGHLYGAPELDP